LTSQDIGASTGCSQPKITPVSCAVEDGGDFLRGRLAVKVLRSGLCMQYNSRSLTRIEAFVVKYMPSVIIKPREFAEALDTDSAARAAFLALPPSHQREYVGWIEEAKKDDTRRRRVQKAVTMLVKK
jgi:hypothetical protein